MVKQQPKKKLKLWAFLFLVWIFAMLVIFQFLDFNKVIGRIEHANFWLLLSAVICFYSSNLIYGISWIGFIKTTKIKAKPRQVFNAAFIGFFFDDVLPTVAPGGEFMMAYVLNKKTGAALPKCLASVVAQMISWFVGFIIFAVIVLAAAIALNQIEPILAIILGLMLVVFALILYFIIHLMLDVNACERAVNRLVCTFSFILRRIGFKTEGAEDWVNAKIRSFHSAVLPFLHKKLLILTSFIIMTLHHFLNALAFFLVLIAFGVQISLVAAFVMFLAIILVSLVSFVPGGLGVHEAVSMSMLSLKGSLVDATLATSVFRIIQYWSVVFIGGLLAVRFEFQALSGQLGKNLLRHKNRSANASKKPGKKKEIKPGRKTRK